MKALGPVYTQGLEQESKSPGFRVHRLMNSSQVCSYCGLDNALHRGHKSLTSSRDLENKAPMFAVIWSCS